MTKSNINPELIHLIGVRVMKAHMQVTDEFMENPKEVPSFKLGSKSETGFNVEENYLRFRLFIKLEGQNEVNSTLGIEGEYIIEFQYIVDNMRDFISYEENKEDYTVDSQLGATIAGISYSTARGIVLERTNGTYFNGVILPVLNPRELLEEDSLF